MTPPAFDPSSLSMLSPPEARDLAEGIARGIGFTITSGRSGDGCYVLEGTRGAGSRAEKAVFLVVLEWPVDLPKLDKRRGVLMNLAGADIRAKSWEVVSQGDIVKMADALGVHLPEEAGRREPPRVEMDPHYLPSVDKLESNMRWGRDFLSEGEYAKAVDYFNRVLRSKPGYTDALRLKGLALAGSGDLDGAEKTLRKALGSNPEDAALWLALASVFERRGGGKDELALVEKALELEPSNPEAWLRRGRIVRGMDLLDEAALCFIKADKHSKGSSEALSGLGSVLVAKGDVAGAEDAFRKSLSLDGKSRDARIGLVQLLLDEGRSEEAAAEANVLTAAYPEDTEASRLRTKALEAADKVKGASAAREKPAITPAPMKDETARKEAKGEGPAKAKPAREDPETGAGDVPPSDIDYYWNKMKSAKAPSVQPAREKAAEGPLARRPPARAAEEKPVEPAPKKQATAQSAKPAKAAQEAPKKAPETSVVKPGISAVELLAKGALAPKTPVADAKAPEVKGKEQGLLDEMLRAELGLAKEKKQAKRELSEIRIEPPAGNDEGKETPEAHLAKLREEYICFGDYDKDDPDCKECEVEQECIEASDDADVSDEYICFGECDEDEEDCKTCPAKEKCEAKKVRDGGEDS